MPIYSPYAAPPRRRQSTGPATAVNPELNGLAQGVNNMAALNQQIAARGTPAYRPTPGPSGLTSYGGGYGRMPGMAGGLFGGAAPPPAATAAAGHSIPLGLAPTNQADFAQRMRTENGARAFGNTLPVMGGQGRPVFASAPAQPTAGIMNNNQMAAFAKDRDLAFNPTTGQMGSTSVRSMDPREAAIAGILGRGPGQARLTPEQANAGRAAALGLAQDRERARREQTLARVGIRANNKQAQFNNQMELGLARANPAAYSQFKQAQGQLGLANANMQATNAYRDKKLAQDRELGLAQIDATKQRSNQALLAKDIDPQTGETINRDPLDRRINDASNVDLSNMSDAEAQAAINKLNVPQETKDRLLADNRRRAATQAARTMTRNSNSAIMGPGWARVADALSGIFGGFNQ